MTANIATRLLEADLLPAIYRTVEAAFPEEGCGFVFENQDGALEVVPTINRATQLHQMDPKTYPRDGRDYFEPDMKPWLRVTREGQVAKVIFHSHPNADAYFSETDHQSAVFVDDDGSVFERNPGVVHLVASVVSNPSGSPATVKVSRLFRYSKQSESFEKIAEYGAAGNLKAET